MTFILAVFFVTMVFTGFVMEILFDALGIVPDSTGGQTATEQGKTRSTAKAPTTQQRQQPSSQSPIPGHLRRDGLRLRPSGRSDSSGVLSPGQFTRPEVKRAYQTARKNSRDAQ